MTYMKSKIAALFVVTTILAGSITSTAFAAGNVYVSGNCLADDQGPFLGLGFTYMQSLRDCKYNRPLYQSELSFMAARGYNYQRMLSMVGGYSAWAGKEIAPVSFTNQVGTFIPAWSDYWQQFRDCIDIAHDSYGIRTEVTIFADAQFIMPSDSQRYAHLDNILSNLAGRTHKVILLEVANEAWQNGFPQESTLRPFCQYLTTRTAIPVALSAPLDASAGGIQALYSGSTADIATVHFSRDLNTVHGHWWPVIDCWDKAVIAGVPPVSSNEPIGPGSSVAEETHPIHLVSAACFGYVAKLPMYVYHTVAGVWHNQPFSQMAGVNDFQWVRKILPTNLPNWTRNDGIQAGAPFTVFCNGNPNLYWWMNTAGSDGCHTNAGARSGTEFICYPQGIRGGGLLLQAREPLTALAVNPMNGAILTGGVMNTGDMAVLPQGPEAWVIRGTQGIAAQTPFAGVIPIPGTVQLENFDNGGEGISYHDAFYGNNSGLYRPSPSHVDIVSSNDGLAQGWNDTGEWLEFTVNVATSGLYSITAKWATGVNGCAIHIEMNGVNVTGSAPLPNTGGPNNWVTGTGYNIPLNAGQQIMRVYTDVGGYNLDWLVFTKQ